MISPDFNPNKPKNPSDLKKALGLLAGGLTAATVYGAEAYAGKFLLEATAALFQSPDTFTSTKGIRLAYINLPDFLKSFHIRYSAFV